MLSALLLVFAGIDLLVNPSHLENSELYGIPFLAAGLAVLALLLRTAPAGAPEARRTLASRLLRLVSLRGRLVPWFPALGIAVIVADLAYNELVFGAVSLRHADTPLLL